MRLRWKLALAALVVFVLGVGVLWQLNGLLAGRGFTQVERTAAEADGRRVADGVGAMAVTLGQLTRLQAVWDDPYQLVAAGDAAGFVDVYPPQDMWQSYRVRYLLVTGLDGGLVGGGTTDTADGSFGPLPDALADAPALSYFSEGGAEASCGLWKVGREGVFTYCTHPVLPTDGSGEPAGYLTMMQPLDQAAIEQLATRLGLLLRAGEDMGVAPEVPGGSEVTVIDDSTLEVRTNVPVNNDPGVGTDLVATIDRPVHRQAVSTQRTILLGTSAVWAIMLAGFLVLVDRKVVARTRALSRELVQVDLDAAEAPLPNVRHSTAIRDEIDELTTAIEHNIRELQERERRVAARVEDAEAMLAAADAARLAAIDERIEAQALRAGPSAGRTHPGDRKA